MHKNLYSILPILTSHNCGEKKVLLSSSETITNITQIAMTTLKAGEEAEEHTHPTMEEYFLIEEGEIVYVINGVEGTYGVGAFIKIDAGTMHKMIAKTDCRFLAIGCAI